VMNSGSFVVPASGDSSERPCQRRMLRYCTPPPAVTPARNLRRV
jgi:hypothetical protein